MSWAACRAFRLDWPVRLYVHDGNSLRGREYKRLEIETGGQDAEALTLGGRPRSLLTATVVLDAPSSSRMPPSKSHMFMSPSGSLVRDGALARLPEGVGVDGVARMRKPWRSTVAGVRWVECATRGVL